MEHDMAGNEVSEENVTLFVWVPNPYEFDMTLLGTLTGGLYFTVLSGNSKDLMLAARGGKIGHCAMMLGDSFYISLWPGEDVQKKQKGDSELQSCIFSTLKRDRKAEGFEPEVFTFKLSKEIIERMKTAYLDAFNTNRMMYFYKASAKQKYRGKFEDKNSRSRCGDIALHTNCVELTWDLLVAGLGSFYVDKEAFKQVAEKASSPGYWKIAADLVGGPRYDVRKMYEFFNVNIVTPSNILDLAKDLTKIYNGKRISHSIEVHNIRKHLKVLYPEEVVEEETSKKTEGCFVM